MQTASQRRPPARAPLVLVAALVVTAASTGIARGQADPPVPPPLSTVPVPEPSNLYDFVKDKNKAIILGKALFWDMQVGSDGDFNGVNPFGSRDPHAKLFRADNPSSQPVEVQVSIPNSSLASQAVGPPINAFEMSADGRTFQAVGHKFARPLRDLLKKLRGLRPLAQQQVHPEDSVLGPHSRYPQNGLSISDHRVLWPRG